LEIRRLPSLDKEGNFLASLANNNGTHLEALTKKDHGFETTLTITFPL
jgi:hypothetical protein